MRLVRPTVLQGVSKDTPAHFGCEGANVKAQHGKVIRMKAMILAGTACAVLMAGAYTIEFQGPTGVAVRMEELRASMAAWNGTDWRDELEEVHHGDSTEPAQPAMAIAEAGDMTRPRNIVFLSNSEGPRLLREALADGR